MDGATLSSAGSVSGAVVRTAVLGQKEPSCNIGEDTVDPNGSAVLTQPGHHLTLTAGAGRHASPSFSARTSLLGAVCSFTEWGWLSWLSHVPESPPDR